MWKGKYHKLHMVEGSGLISIENILLPFHNPEIRKHKFCLHHHQLRSPKSQISIHHDDLYWKLDLFTNTVKPVYNDHPWDTKIVAVVDMLLLKG